MTGYRVGAVVAEPSLLAEIEKILDCISICPAHISQEAAIYALQHLDGWLDQKAALIKERLDILREVFGDPTLDYELVSSGACFAYVRHPFETTPGIDVARRLAEGHDLLCFPGSFFGPGQERYLRLTFANVDRPDLKEVGKRLAASSG